MRVTSSWDQTAFPLILLEAPNLLRLRIDRIAQLHDIRSNVELFCNGFWLTKSLLRAGAGSVVGELQLGHFDVTAIRNPDVP